MENPQRKIHQNFVRYVGQETSKTIENVISKLNIFISN